MSRNAGDARLAVRLPVDADALLSPEQVTRRCGLSRGAVYRAIDRSGLRASRLCSRVHSSAADEMTKAIRRVTPLEERRDSLRRADAVLTTLPPRLALEHGDAVKIAAERCRWSSEAARRDFPDKYFRDVGNHVAPRWRETWRLELSCSAGWSS